MTDQGSEDARVGYQVAVNMWNYEGQILWSKFNAFLIANSILLGGTGLALSEGTTLGACGSFVKVMCIAGILLCVIWFLLMERSWGCYRYWIFSAREIEEKFMSGAVQTISRGGEFADLGNATLEIGGKPQQVKMTLLGRLKIRWASYLLIFLFLCTYIWIGAQFIFI